MRRLSTGLALPAFIWACLLPSRWHSDRDSFQYDKQHRYPASTHTDHMRMAAPVCCRAGPAPRRARALLAPREPSRPQTQCSCPPTGSPGSYSPYPHGLPPPDPPQDPLDPSHPPAGHMQSEWTCCLAHGQPHADKTVRTHNDLIPPQPVLGLDGWRDAFTALGCVHVEWCSSPAAGAQGEASWPLCQVCRAIPDGVAC